MPKAAVQKAQTNASGQEKKQLRVVLIRKVTGRKLVLTTLENY